MVVDKCAISSCENKVLEGLQFCQKHALAYPDMAKIDFEKETALVNKLRIDLIDILSKYLDLQPASFAMATSMASAQILAAKSYRKGAKEQDALSFLYIKYFKEYYKDTLKDIKEKFG